MDIARGRTDGILTGIALILLTVMSMALADAFIKYASSDMTLWQIYVLRSILVLPALALLVRGTIRPKAPFWVALRSALLVLMYLALYSVIPVLDLSVFAAALYTGPLFIVMLAALFLRERIGKRQWLAILVGFLGALVILRPATDQFTPFALVPVIAALLYALAAIVTRAKCSAETPAALAVALNAALLATGMLISLALAIWQPNQGESYPFLLGTWSEPDLRSWQIIAILAALMIVISLGLARAYQSPKPQTIATFDYAYLIFAGIWGYIFFGEVPDALTLVGMAMIGGAGLLVVCVPLAPGKGR